MQTEELIYKREIEQFYPTVHFLIKKGVSKSNKKNIYSL